MQPQTGTTNAVGTEQDRKEAVLRQLWLQDISVRTKDGVVVLTGVVSTIEEKMAAGQVAKSVYGVKGVANYIAVRP